MHYYALAILLVVSSKEGALKGTLTIVSQKDDKGLPNRRIFELKYYAESVQKNIGITQKKF